MNVKKINSLGSLFYDNKEQWVMVTLINDTFTLLVHVGQDCLSLPVS